MKTSQELNNTQKDTKEIYEKPQIEVIEMEMEDGVLLSASSGGDNYKGGGGGGGAW
ncbi:MAG: hypothetical protein ACK5KT_01665 [Dysgonomonas sp.]